MIENPRNGQEPTFRAAYRNGDREGASRALMKDLEGLVLGEPSQSFFPPRVEQEIATPQDVAERINYQNERCVELLHYGSWNPGNLPESWRRYLVGHWEQIIQLIERRDNSVSPNTSEVVV